MVGLSGVVGGASERGRAGGRERKVRNGDMSCWVKVHSGEITSSLAPFYEGKKLNISTAVQAVEKPLESGRAESDLRCRGCVLHTRLKSPCQTPVGVTGRNNVHLADTLTSVVKNLMTVSHMWKRKLTVSLVCAV